MFEGSIRIAYAREQRGLRSLRYIWDGPWSHKLLLLCNWFFQILALYL